MWVFENLLAELCECGMKTTNKLNHCLLYCVINCWIFFYLRYQLMGAGRWWWEVSVAYPGKADLTEVMPSCKRQAIFLFFIGVSLRSFDDMQQFVKILLISIFSDFLGSPTSNHYHFFFSRFLLLKKIPTRRKLTSAAIIVLGLFICLIPTMFPWIDPEASTRHDLGGETGLARILWPVTFMVGLVSKTLWRIIDGISSTLL